VTSQNANIKNNIMKTECPKKEKNGEKAEVPRVRDGPKEGGRKKEEGKTRGN